jgi:hypothetical protein
MNRDDARECLDLWITLGCQDAIKIERKREKDSEDTIICYCGGREMAKKDFKRFTSIWNFG